MNGMTNRQKAAVIGGPLVVLAIGLGLHVFIGMAALFIMVGLMGMLLTFLVVEGRNFNLRFFDRQIHDAYVAYRQIEALQGLYWSLKPDAPLPHTRVWAASPDLLQEIATHVLRERPQYVVEASSGTSTVVIALCLRKLGAGHVTALEHDAIYAERTRAALADHGLSDLATVVHAPLVKQVVNGTEHPWYDLSGTTLERPIDLLVVDGPPEAVGSLARYPAVPLLVARFNKGARVLLDDGDRDDERMVAERWAREHSGSRLEYLPFESGAWSLRFP